MLIDNGIFNDITNVEKNYMNLLMKCHGIASVQICGFWSVWKNSQISLRKSHLFRELLLFFVNFLYFYQPTTKNYKWKTKNQDWHCSNWHCNGQSEAGRLFAVCAICHDDSTQVTEKKREHVVHLFERLKVQILLRKNHFWLYFRDYW